jgi:hypothetical protein
MSYLHLSGDIGYTKIALSPFQISTFPSHIAEIPVFGCNCKILAIAQPSNSEHSQKNTHRVTVGDRVFGLIG